MSSKYVRDQIKNFINTNIPSESPVDLTGQFDNLFKVLDDNGVGKKDDWLGIQFIGTIETPTTVGATNTRGGYREEGSVFLHVVSYVAPNGSGSPEDRIIDRSEIIRNEFRGQRIGDIVIESVTPPNFQSAATLQFNGGFTSASVVINFYRDINL